ncbi:MAG: DUF1508 domain-containing protein [Betaproteobacteria bacterium]|nr:MAG: DUF1508 domain-containing protein [Betaproteobacteria bacterium]TAG47159.1 MAG: DUF1508 domain-containing protein [Betaproteobacteria bacterium]
MAKKEHKWVFFLDKAGKTRWRRIASNGNIIGASSQGYVTMTDAFNNACLNGYTGEKWKPLARIIPKPPKPM